MRSFSDDSPGSGDDSSPRPGPVGRYSRPKFSEIFPSFSSTGCASTLMRTSR